MEEAMKKIEQAIEYIMEKQHDKVWCKHDQEWEREDRHEYD